MIDSAQIKQTSTAATSPLESKFLGANPKIIGYLTQIEQCHQKLIPLKKILPVSSTLLNFILYNLISIILEVVKRDLPTPDIRIDKIMVIEDNYENGIPFIISKQDGTTAKNCEEILLRHFQNLCSLLGCNSDLICSTTLIEFQNSLFSKNNFQQASFEGNFEIVLKYFQIKTLETRYSNDFTCVFQIECPKFLSKSHIEDQIAIKLSIQNQEIYELREIQIIEEFNHKHLPYLYGYLRYSDFMILFLKKHDLTFSSISSKIFKKRRDLQQVQIEQILLKLYRQMVIAISYLHSIEVIHRDLKPENIMFDFSSPINNMDEILDTQTTCVLIDFDRSTMAENLQPQAISHHVGTPFYRPPEGEQKKYYPSYDIWQLGFIWLVIQKDFFHITKLDEFSSKQASIQSFNVNIQNNKDQIEKIKEQMKYSTEKQDSIYQLQSQINQLQNNINNQMNEQRSCYIELIKHIEGKENCFIYSNDLQNIIKKMIEFEPQNRTTLDSVLRALEQIIK